MKKLKKKGAFDVINAGMIGFVGFVLTVLLTVLLISTLLTTSIIQRETTNLSDPTTFGAPYNATLELQEASNLPPQFAQIIVIVVVIVGILGMLAFLGYAGYKKFR